MTVKNVFLSLFLSLALTFVCIVLYVLYPLLSLIVGSLFRTVFLSNTHSDGVAAVAGGVSEAVVLIAVVMASALFLFIFRLLQRRSRR